MFRLCGVAYEHHPHLITKIIIYISVCRAVPSFVQVCLKSKWISVNKMHLLCHMFLAKLDGVAPLIADPPPLKLNQ